MSKPTYYPRLPLALLLSFFLACRPTTTEESIQVQDLKAPVEILVDNWGIPHIYAENEEDLFFTQGYYAAKDRLFQFEVWRRQATGTVAEILGPRELRRDIGTRLFKFRGDMDAEMQHYHENGKAIIEAYVKGVNAYIEEVNQKPERLPMEFQLLGIRPEAWTPDVVISRHQGLLGNIDQELDVGRVVAKIGAAKAQQLYWFHPHEPKLELDPKIDKELLFEDILGLYNAYRRPVIFQPEDLLNAQHARSNAGEPMAMREDLFNEELGIGSNNWLISGDKTQSGKPIMANDPHRTLAVPSLRYMAHLVAPGWNVIGGGEPEIPGISIGHNEHGAWGLTVFRTDAEDLYQYETNPANPNQYKFNGKWEDFSIIEETISIKGQKDTVVQLKYSHHGPVVYEKPSKRAAFAVRCGWLEIGGSPYLASLRMDQAKDFAEFREACNYSNIPGENMIWAGKDGELGWQAVGIAPIRPNFSGMVPVPGDGSHEWDGYLEIKKRPNLRNMPEGYFATANQNVTPEGFPHYDALGYSWSDPFRGDRLNAALASKDDWDVMASAALQTDYLSLPAKQLVPYLKDLTFGNDRLTAARDQLKGWDCTLSPNSIPAGIYVAWEKEVDDAVWEAVVPEEAKAYLSGIQFTKVLEILEKPEEWDMTATQRDELLTQAFSKAIQHLTEGLGENMEGWVYGQEDYKHVEFKHPLSWAVNDSIRKIIEVGPAPRGGNSYTVGNTSGNDNQRSGATFKVIIDTGDWDQALAANSPGQAGNPLGAFYRNLFEMWAGDRYFPLLYSKEKVERASRTKINLEPGK